MNEKIEVRATELATIPGTNYETHHHLFLVYTNNEGKEYYLRGGPERDIPRTSTKIVNDSTDGKDSSSIVSEGSIEYNLFGRVVSVYGEYRENTPDWPKPGETVQSVIVAEGENLSEEYKKLQTEINNFNNANIPYNPFKSNSNSVVTSALRNIGIQPKIPPEVLAPGDETLLKGKTASEVLKELREKAERRDKHKIDPNQCKIKCHSNAIKKAEYPELSVQFTSKKSSFMDKSNSSIQQNREKLETVVDKSNDEWKLLDWIFGE